MRYATKDWRATVMAGIILAYVWRFHILAPGMEALRISAILTLSSWAFLALAPGWAHLSKALRIPFVWLYLVLIAWAVVGHLFALEPGVSSQVLKGVHLTNVLFTLFILSTITTYVRLEVAMAANAFGAAVLAFYYIKGGTPTMWTPVSTYDRNDLALLFNLSLPIVLWLFVEQKVRWTKLALGLLAVALGFCVLMSQSRGGFLGLAAILLYFMVTESSVRLRYRLTPVLALGLGLALMPADVKDRLSTLRSLEDDYNVESATGRVEIWKRALKYVDQRPVFGVGIANFPIAESRLSDEARQFGGRWKASVAHNSYVEITAETGIPGGILYLSMVLSLVGWLARWRKRLKRARHLGGARLDALYRLLNSMTASALGFALGSFVLSTFSLSLLVMLLGLSGGVIMVASRTLDEARRRPGSRRGNRPRRRPGRRSTSRSPVLLHAP
ncbi:MAG: O-antigen ligase family protein [Longimicrobiales bacterium]